MLYTAHHSFKNSYKINNPDILKSNTSNLNSCKKALFLRKMEEIEYMGSSSTELILTCGEKRTDLLKEQATKCRHCPQPAKIHLPYTKLDLCASHFTHLLEKRVKYTVRKYKLIQAKEKIVIGVSGGKLFEKQYH